MPNDTTIPLDDPADREAAESVMRAVGEAEKALEWARAKAGTVLHAIAKRQCPNAPAGPFRIVPNRNKDGLDAIVFTTPAANEPAIQPAPEAVTAPVNGGTHA